MTLTFWLKLDGVLRAIVSAAARLSGWLLLVLMGVIIFDVVTRRFFILGSTALQEFEWHLHAAILLLALGYGYLVDVHVRIGVFFDRLGPRLRALIELTGCLLFLLPFVVVTFYYGSDFAYTSWLQGEVSSSPDGLPQRWIVKALIPLGILILLLAGISIFLRNLLILSGLRVPAPPDRTTPPAAG
jgi:TRAP-type mannitol/chloroaromatic compound transport system permease small subunit